MNPHISARQKQIYQYIVKFRKVVGVSPTQHELAAAIGVTRPAVQYHLQKLEAAGWVDKVPGRKGGILPSTEARAFEVMPDMLRIISKIATAKPEDLPMLRQEAELLDCCK